MSYTALYRKFRPDAFDQVKGQEHFTETIKDEWDNPHHFIKIYNTARTAMVLKWHK